MFIMNNSQDNRFSTASAVMLLLTRNNGTEVLLQKRVNTGYMDGMWDCGASGHVDAGESMKSALIREAKEEINIDININDVNFATIAHKYTNGSGLIYYNGYFIVENYKGIPKINEPNKCSEIKWVQINGLPENTIPDRKEAVKNFLLGIPYHEFGWIDHK